MKIKNDLIEFDNGFKIKLNRTIRIPEDGNAHGLPPSMGNFPMKRIEDYKDKVPETWKGHGGVFIPMYEREAMWLGFHGPTTALKIATGKVNAVSGGKWTQELQPPTGVDGKDPEQDYMVAPQPQPWLDGYNIGGGQIRQFVAMAMGKGYTVEAQVTGKEDVGGIQVLVIPAKPGKFPVTQGVTRSGMTLYAADCSIGEPLTIPSFESDFSTSAISAGALSYKSATTTSPTQSRSEKRLTKSAEIGLAQGGRLNQEISVDPHGIDTWDQSKAERIFIHIVNATMWEEITGEKCPDSPIAASEYKGSYFTYENGHDAVKGSGTLGNVKPVSEKDKDHGFVGQQDDSPLNEKVTNPSVSIKGSPPSPKNLIKDGTW